MCELRWNQPTIDLTKGFVRTCCRVPHYRVTAKDVGDFGTDSILNNQYLLDRRLEMFKGTRHPDCSPCWKAESSGQPSPRIGAQNVLKSLKGADPLRLDAGARALKASAIPFLEVQLGNLCDLKCVYCWRGNSSRWMQEDLQYGGMNQADYDWENAQAPAGFTDTYWAWFTTVAGGLKTVSFVGGEPTMHADFPELLLKTHRLLELHGNVRCRLRIVTNLNCKPKLFERLLEVLELLGRGGRICLIDLSMESVGKRAEFIRFGLEWARFEENLLTLLERRIQHSQVSVSATINTLCVTSFAALIDFLAPLRRRFAISIPFIENSVIYPLWLAPEILTPDFKNHLAATAERLVHHESDYSYFRARPKWGQNWAEYSNYVRSMGEAINHDADTSDKRIQWARCLFARGIRRLEERRGLNFLHEFPEFQQFFQICEVQRLRNE